MRRLALATALVAIFIAVARSRVCVEVWHTAVDRTG